MPSNFCFDVSSDKVSIRLSSSRSLTRYVFVNDTCTNSTNALADRIQDHAQLLTHANTTTTIFLDQLPFEDDDEYAYKAILLSKDNKSGKRKVLLEGAYEYGGSKSEAKRKSLESLLKKSGEKVREAMEKGKVDAVEKPKAGPAKGKWVFLLD